MITLNDLAYRIFESIRGDIGDDDSIDIRQIKHDIHNKRAQWLARELAQKDYIDDSYTQDLGCVALEIADAADCCDITVGCKVLRTVLEIPRTIATKFSDGITRVGPINKIQSRFIYVSPERIPWTNHGRFNKNAIFVFRLNDRMYLKGHEDNQDWKHIEVINIKGMFEDPTSVSNFTNCDGSAPCYTDNDEYPVTRKLTNFIEAEVKAMYIQAEAIAPSDNTNDAKSNIERQ